jgi:hypothetical protein
MKRTSITVQPALHARTTCPACDAPVASALQRRGRACWFCDAPLSADDPPRVVAEKINPEHPLHVARERR